MPQMARTIKLSMDLSTVPTNQTQRERTLSVHLTRSLQSFYFLLVFLGRAFYSFFTPHVYIIIVFIRCICTDDSLCLCVLFKYYLPIGHVQQIRARRYRHTFRDNNRCQCHGPGGNAATSPHIVREQSAKGNKRSEYGK